MPQVRLTLPELHPGQAAVESSTEPYNVLPCGRRWGKTRYFAHRGTRCAWAGGKAWWIFPSHPISRPASGILRDIAAQIARSGGPGRYNEVDRALIFPSGGELLLRSADNPQSLVGEGLDEVYFDECGLHKEITWQESIRPTLIDRGGRAWFGGVPKGTQGLLYLARNKALAGDSGWKLHAATTFDNPWLPKMELERLRQEYAAGQIPERYYRQEYLAEFLPVEGEVFRHVLECATAVSRETPELGKSYAIGVDWGKRHDWCVFSVFCLEDREQVYLDRFRAEYVIAKQRLAALAQRFRPLEIVAEENAMGDPICEDLEREGLPIRRFTTTQASKQIAVDALALAFEQQSIRILAEPEQIAELQAFEATTLPSNRTRYAAPGGGHDDIVMADTFAWSAVTCGHEDVVHWG